MLPLYELIDAIKSNNVADTKAALDKNADPNGKDFGRLSMLQLAEKRHANSVVPLLVQYGADLFERVGSKKDSLLHRAARSGNVGFACALLDAGLSPNIQNDLAEVPLHIAARTGQSYLARYLANHNADVLIQDSKGRTPLGVAFATKQYELVRLLEPIEIRARRFSRNQNDDSESPSVATPTDWSPALELQTASENDPNDSDENRFSKRLALDRGRTASDFGYGR